MGWRGTLVLLLLVVAAGAAYLMSPTPDVVLPEGTLLGEPRYLRETTPSPRLLEFDAARISEMTLGFHDEVVTVARQGDTWRGAADARPLNDFLAGLANASMLSSVEGDSPLADFGLDVPARRIRLETDKGAAQVLVIGDRNPAGTSVYVRANDGPVILAGALVMWEFDKAFAAVTGRKSRL
jgi:hypothetical protein